MTVQLITHDFINHGRMYLEVLNIYLTLCFIHSYLIVKVGQNEEEEKEQFAKICPRFENNSCY